MRTALYLVSANLRDDVSDGRLLGRQHYCHDVTAEAVSYAAGIATLVDEQVVRVGDVALALFSDTQADRGRVLTPTGWRPMTAAELNDWTCRTEQCPRLAHDCTGPALLCEHCADAL